MAAKKAGLKMTGDWRQAKEVLAAGPQELDQALEAATLALAEFLLGKIKQKIGSNIPPPNSPLTLLMKGTSKTLIRKGDMRNAARTIKVGKHAYFVGIPASAKFGGRTGKAKSIASIAAVHEKGATIVMSMTPKQRRWLHANLGAKVSKIPTGASTGVIVIHIPPRPFIEPVFQEWGGAKSKELFQKLVIANLKKLAPQGGGGGSASVPGVGTPSRGGAAAGGGEAGGTGPVGSSKQRKSPADRRAAALKGWTTRMRRQNERSKGGGA